MQDDDYDVYASREISEWEVIVSAYACGGVGRSANACVELY